MQRHQHSRIDPRTLTTVGRYAACHILPRRFGLSSATVLLDGDVDSKIGGWCDGQLRRYFDTLLLQPTDGQLVLAGRKARLRGRFDTRTSTFRGRVRCNPAQFRRAIGAGEDELDVQCFEGQVVDTFAAHVSIMHSAFLLLYSQGYPDVCSTRFDWVRGVLLRALGRKLTTQDGALLQERISLTVGIPARLITAPMPKLEALRLHYSPDYDLGDGVLTDFPSRSFEESEDQWSVTLPYSSSLRAVVAFPK